MHRNLLHSYKLMTKNMKEKLRKHSHSPLQQKEDRNIIAAVKASFATGKYCNTVNMRYPCHLLQYYPSPGPSLRATTHSNSSPSPLPHSSPLPLSHSSPLSWYLSYRTLPLAALLYSYFLCVALYCSFSTQD